MAKHHTSSPPPPSTGTATHSLPATPPSASQLSMQLKQDLAMLSHKDPDTRRSSMEALKLFIEGELDARSMPGFLEQVSGETGKSSGSYAISLFVEVARVHKEATVPFIPRIMAAVLRNLASSSGGAGHANNLHQACAKVVAAVARYAIEPASSITRSSSATDVLDSLCQPLLGLLSSNVEPVAVGSATCLQAIVEAENWKLAAPELVHDVCSRSSISLAEKGKHSIAHMHLVRSLAKFNAGTLQEYAGSLLKVGVHVLVATGASTPGCGSWQQRAAAAQLLGTLIGCLDHRALASELISTTKALENCRLDKVATVRQAVGEALSAAKSMALKIDPLLLHDGASAEVNLTNSSPASSRIPETRKRVARKKNISRTEESCGSTINVNDLILGSQESQFVSYASSPSSSTTSISTPSLGSSSPPPTANSTAKIGRSPLYPAKQSPVRPHSSIDRYMTEPDMPYILAHMKSSDFKENTPLRTKVEEGNVLSKSDDIGYLLHTTRNKITRESEAAEFVSGSTDGNAYLTDFDSQFLAEECIEADTLESDSSSEKDASIEWDKISRNSGKDVICEQVGEKNGLMHFNSEEDKFLEHAKANRQSTLYRRTQRKTPYAQGVKNCMSAEDFLIFSTPRRLVRSLQSVSSTPDSKGSPERDQGLDLDCETLSESGWSVRDNPIAGDNEEESPRQASIHGQKDMLTRSMEGVMGVFGEGLAAQFDKERMARFSESANRINSEVEAPPSGHAHDTSCDVKSSNKSTCTIFLSKGCSSACPTSPAGSGLNSPSVEEQQQTSSSSKPRNSRKWMRSMLRKLHFYVEMLLFGTLLVVLAFATFIAFLSIKGQHELHREPYGTVLPIRQSKGMALPTLCGDAISHLGGLLLELQPSGVPEFYKDTHGASLVFSAICGQEQGEKCQYLHVASLASSAICGQEQGEKCRFLRCKL